MNHAPPTPEQIKTITTYIVAGGTSHVAAQAAGVSRPVYRDWMKRGRDPDAAPVFRHFRAAVQQALAQSRLDAEISVRKNRPLDWLRYGPGKGSPRRPDWTAAYKAPTRPASTRGNPLLLPAVRAFIHDLLEALQPFPEARTASAAALCKAETLAKSKRRSPSHIDT